MSLLSLCIQCIWHLKCKLFPYSNSQYSPFKVVCTVILRATFQKLVIFFFGIWPFFTVINSYLSENDYFGYFYSEYDYYTFLKIWQPCFSSSVFHVRIQSDWLSVHWRGSNRIDCVKSTCSLENYLCLSFRN